MATYTTSTTTIITCPSCNGGQVKKIGKRNNQQRYQCACSKRFRANGNVEGKNHDTVQIGMTTRNFFSGLSLDHLASDIEVRYGRKKPSRQTVYNWIMENVHKARFMLDGVKADTSSHWVIDEQRINIGTELIYNFNVMDYRTRFLLASYLSADKSRISAEKVLRKALKVAKNPPKRITTDKLPSYKTAIRRVFPDAEHIESLGPGKYPNNNRSERVQGTFRARTKTLRCLKGIESGQEFLDGFVINYNYFRKHTALKGKTPAEAAGIEAPFKTWADVVSAPIKVPKRVPHSRPRRKAPVDGLPRDLTERKRIQRARHRAAKKAKKRARQIKEKPSDGTIPMLNSKTLDTSSQYKKSIKDTQQQYGDRLRQHEKATPRTELPDTKLSPKPVRDDIELRMNLDFSSPKQESGQMLRKKVTPPEPDLSVTKTKPKVAGGGMEERMNIPPTTPKGLRPKPAGSKRRKHR